MTCYLTDGTFLHDRHEGEPGPSGSIEALALCRVIEKLTFLRGATDAEDVGPRPTVGLLWSAPDIMSAAVNARFSTSLTRDFLWLQYIRAQGLSVRGCHELH